MGSVTHSVGYHTSSTITSHPSSVAKAIISSASVYINRVEKRDRSCVRACVGGNKGQRETNVDYETVSSYCYDCCRFEGNIGGNTVHERAKPYAYYLSRTHIICMPPGTKMYSYYTVHVVVGLICADLSNGTSLEKKRRWAWPTLNSKPINFAAT